MGAQGEAQVVTVVAFVPDLMDRSRLSAAVPGAVFVSDPAALVSTPGDVVVVDLSRPGVLEVLPELAGRRTVGFGSHVDRALLGAARSAGCAEVLARSEFFRRIPALLS
jgi:hypothetical protein